MRRLLVLLITVLLASVAVAATAPLPGDSVLRVPATFTDQDGKAFTLAQRRGGVQLVTMFYSSCPYACPLIIDTGKGIDHALGAAERAKLRVLLLSLDPARDTPAKLSALATKRKIDRARWTLATTDAGGVRQTAAALGIRYRQLANGEFNHSSVMILLDADGRILARTETIGPQPDPEFLAAVRKALGT
jgi:protein SCO1/2